VTSEPIPDVLDTAEAAPAVIRGGALRAGGYVAGLVLGLASAPFLVRHLGNVGFGRYTLVLSIIALVQGLTEGGLSGIGLREYTLRRGDERERLMRNLLGVRIALTLVGIATAVGFAIVAGYDRTIVLGTVIAGAGLFVGVVQSLVAIPLAVNLRFGWATVTELVRQAVAVALTLALIIAGARLLPFWAVTFVGGSVALLMTATLVRGAMPFRPAFHFGEWRTLTLGMLPYAAATALNVAYFRIAIILMSLMSTATETGYFSISFRITEILLPVPGLLVAAVFPIVARAARDDSHRLAYVSGRIYETALLVGTWLVICVELGAPFAIRFLAGPDGEPSVEVLRIQAIALLATFVAVACGFVLLSLHRHRELLVANLMALVFSAGLIVALVGPLGAKGAAIGTASAECVLALVSTGLMIRARAELRPPVHVVGIAALAAAPALGIAFIPGLHPIFAVIIASAFYFGILHALGRIPSELIDAMPRRRGAAG
jgi:O-antigen/teichoic acid export membrane protein